jgi:2',3'-cyclic-nucleotide 2'-phosphodiesterase (5'-nucleotidase family)
MHVWGNGGVSSAYSTRFKQEKKEHNPYQLKDKGALKYQQNPSLKQMVTFAGEKVKQAIENPLTILYMADTHKSLGQMARLKTAIDTYKKDPKNSLTIHAGDYAMGTKGMKLQVELLNKFGVDYATLGNHEFFSGTDGMVQALNNSEFQTVITNLEVPKANPLTKLYDNNKIVKSTVKEIDGKKYAFVGAVTNSINGESYENYLGGIKSLKPVVELNREVQNLEKQGIDRIILISHLGYMQDKAVAENVPGIDIILGGHTHLALPGIKKDLNLFHTPRNNEPVLILHAGAYAEALGVTHVVFNNEGLLQVKPTQNRAETFINKIIRLLRGNNYAKPREDKSVTDNLLVDVSTFKPDPQVAEIVKKVESKMNRLGTLKKPVNGNWPLWGSSEVGSLTADAVRKQTGAEISLVQAGCIRHSIDKGDVFAEYVKDNVLPFNTPVVKVELSGMDILRTLNKGAETAGTHKKPGLLQVSGLKYTIDMKRNEKARVVPEEVYIEKNGNYERLDPQKNYVVAYDKYLLRGGDRLTSLKNGKVLQEFPAMSYANALVKELSELIKNNNTISLDFSDRIVIKNKPGETSWFNKLLVLLGIKRNSRIDQFVFKG